VILAWWGKCPPSSGPLSKFAKTCETSRGVCAHRASTAQCASFANFIEGSQPPPSAGRTPHHGAMQNSSGYAKGDPKQSCPQWAAKNAPSKSSQNTRILRAFARKIAALALLLLVTLSASTAYAEPPTFRRPRGMFLLGIDVFKPVLNDLGKHSLVGLSVFGEVAIQAGYFAFAARFGSARGFTKKEFLPFDQGYQIVYLTVGPRFYYSPFRRLMLSFYVQPEVSLQVYQSNTLVGITGNETLQGAAGGSIGASYILGILVVSAQVSTQYIWELKSLMVTGGISVGLSSTFE